MQSERVYWQERCSPTDRMRIKLSDAEQTYVMAEQEQGDSGGWKASGRALPEDGGAERMN